MTVAGQRAYWNHGVDFVPWRTGAAPVMDCADIRAVCAGLGIALPFTGTVLDVGCGTGRLAHLCSPERYLGVDVAPDAVAYCRRQGLEASLIDGPDHLYLQQPSVIACLSVFTHVDRQTRCDYLAAFRDLHPDHLLVDVIPGDGSGTIALWTADWRAFLQDFAGTGWQIAAGPHDQQAWDGTTHRYLWGQPCP